MPRLLPSLALPLALALTAGCDALNPDDSGAAAPLTLVIEGHVASAQFLDDRRVAFVHAEYGPVVDGRSVTRYVLHTHDVTTGDDQTRLLMETDLSGEFISDLVVAPGGQSLAYQRYFYDPRLVQADEVVVASGDGSEPRVVAREGTGPFAEALTVIPVAFSPDGGRLLLACEVQLRENASGFSAWVLDLGTGVASRLTGPESTFPRAFTPDGRAVLLEAEGRLYLADAASGALTSLVAEAAFAAQDARHSFSADGRRLLHGVFSPNPAPYGSSDVVVRTEGTPGTRRLNESRGVNTPVSLSGDGRLALYAVRRVERDGVRNESYLVDVDGRRHLRLAGSFWNALPLGFSPSASRALIWAERSPGVPALYAVSVTS